MKTFKLRNVKNMAVWFFMITAGFAVQAGDNPVDAVPNAITGDTDTEGLFRWRDPVSGTVVATRCLKYREPTENDFPTIGINVRPFIDRPEPPAPIRRHIRNLVRNEGAFNRHMPQLVGFLQGYIGRDGVENLDRKTKRLLVQRMWALNRGHPGANDQTSCLSFSRFDLNEPPVPLGAADGNCVTTRYGRAVSQLERLSNNVRSLESVVGKEKMSQAIRNHKTMSSLLSNNYNLSDHRNYGVIKEFLGEQDARQALGSLLSDNLGPDNLRLINNVTTNDLERVLETLQARYGKQRVADKLKTHLRYFLAPDQALLDEFKRSYPNVRPLVMAPYNNCLHWVEVSPGNDKVNDQVAPPVTTPSPQGQQQSRGSAGQ